MKTSDLLKTIGPGLVLAAAGVGAGDVINSAVGGASYGYALLWVIPLGAILKFSLNEGIIRWQLGTDSTIISGWASLGRWVNIYFLIYLVIWAFVVGGALLSSVGVVTRALIPALSVNQGAVLSAFLVLALTLTRRYALFELVMKILVGLMFLTFVGAAVVVRPDLSAALRGLVIPSPGSAPLFYILAIVGGVGASVTIMAYGYWVMERNQDRPENINLVRVDLGLGYILTAVFDLAVLIVAAAAVSGAALKGQAGIIALAEALGELVGRWGYWCFIAGFWGAIFSSLMSFYQAIPYLFVDVAAQLKGLSGQERRSFTRDKGKWYLAFVIYCFAPPMVLLLIQKPVLLIQAFSVLGAVYMPFLAAALLVINNRRNPRFKNGPLANFLLLLNLALFIVLSLRELIRLFS